VAATGPRIDDSAASPTPGSRSTLPPRQIGLICANLVDLYSMGRPAGVARIRPVSGLAGVRSAGVARSCPGSGATRSDGIWCCTCHAHPRHNDYDYCESVASISGDLRGSSVLALDAL
jgi:hypothetical protein